MGRDETRATGHLMGADRLLLGAALALLVAITAWRAEGAVSSPTPTEATSPAAERIVSVLEPLLGEGRIRATARRDADGMVYYVLADAPATETETLIARFTPAIAATTGFSASRGDRLLIEAAPFAPGLSGRIDRSEAMELVALALTGLLVLAGLILPRRSSEPARQAAPSPLVDVRPLRPETVADETSPDVVSASQAATRDPARAAAVIRRWMAPGDAA